MNNKALLRYNNGNFNTTNIDLTSLSQTLNQPIASVTIDSTCLGRKKVLVNFEGNINVRQIGGLFTGTFIFTLLKTCKESMNRQAIAVYSYNFLSFVNFFPQDRAINFPYPCCDDQCACDYCCTYTLELTRVSSETPVLVEVSINGTISVLAVAA